LAAFKNAKASTKQNNEALRETRKAARTNINKPMPGSYVANCMTRGELRLQHAGYSKRQTANVPVFGGMTFAKYKPAS
jgi:hypothetical protein